MNRSLVFLLPVLLAGCKTYTISPESLKQQLMRAQPTTVHTTGPFGEVHSYQANNIAMIACTDKDGNAVELRNGPSIEARITLSSGSRKLTYFDRIELRNDTLITHPSRFVPTMEFRIPFSEVVRIQVQDGRKDFRYE